MAESELREATGGAVGGGLGGGLLRPEAAATAPTAAAAPTTPRTMGTVLEWPLAGAAGAADGEGRAAGVGMGEGGAGDGLASALSPRT